MSFINEIFKISLFLSVGVKIDFENVKCDLDAKGVKWQNTEKIRDQVLLATGILPLPNTSRINGHAWK
jgi:hypothetical protein